jgi:uncharacterized protein (UPF0332 family)
VNEVVLERACSRSAHFENARRVSLGLVGIRLGFLKGRYGRDVRWRDGETVVDFLLQRGRLETVAADVEESCGALLERATKRLTTAQAAVAGEDWEGAFANAYDVYRMAAELLLLRQGLRATGGDGSHVAVEDAVSAQFATRIAGFSKVRFERMRQGRHASQYFDPARPEKTDDDARWALDLAEEVLSATQEVLRSGSLSLYE